MKVAVISDIHGNYDALVAVLKEAKQQNVEHLLILGDIVGYYYHPDKILKVLSEWNYDCIKGNHESILENLIHDPSLSEAIRLKYGSGHQQALDKLSEEQIQNLITLPETKDVEFENTSCLMCHGSPWANDFYIYPDCDSKTANRCNSLTHDFVLIGHSHYAFAIKTEDSVLLNPGSVGQSRQKGGMAYWSIINTINTSFQMISTPYNTDKLLNEIAVLDSDIKYLSKILKR